MLKALQTEIDRVKTEGVTAEELSRAKRQFARDYILGRETVQQKALHLAHAVVIHNDIKTADGEFDLFQNVTLADVQRVARTYFTPEVADAADDPADAPARRRARRAMRTRRRSSSPRSRRLLAGVALHAQWPAVDVADVAAARRRCRRGAVVVPAVQLKTLANGLQVLVVLHHEQPSVSFRLLVRAGAVQEPADKPGVASFVASLLNQGTTTRSAEEIANAIDSAGGIVGVGSGNELTFVNGAVIKDQTDLVLGLASDMVQHPAFAPEEIDRQRKQALSSLQVSYDDPDYLADLVFDRLVFGFHPYGRPNEGTPRVDRADHARRPRRVSPHLVRAEQRAARHRRRPDGRRGVCGRREGVRRLGDARRAGRSSPSTRRRRRGASSSSIGPDRRRPRFASGTSAIAAHASGLPAARPGDPHSRRRGREPAVRRAAHRIAA